MINNIISNTEDINNITTSISSGAQYVILHSKNGWRNSNILTLENGFGSA
jgi:hypothetical protein